MSEPFKFICHLPPAFFDLKFILLTAKKEEQERTHNLESNLSVNIGSISHCVTLGKFLNFSESQLPQLKNSMLMTTVYSYRNEIVCIY